MNSLIYSYKLGLGDFDTDNFSGDGFLWIIFLITTFIVQVTLFNMLIAIMGDTFARVMETKIESGLNEKISMLAEFSYVLKLFKIDLKAQYLYIVTPPEDIQVESEEWTGTLSSIKKAINVSHE